MISGRASAILGLVLAVLPGASRAQEIRITPVVTTSTSIPGGVKGEPATFQYFRSAVIDGNRVAFSGEAPNFSGLYLANTTGGALHAIATSETPVPGGVGNFGRFFLMSISDDGLAFMPRSVGGDHHLGVFRAQGTSLIKIVDKSTPIPGGSDHFTGISEAVSIDNGRVLFHNWLRPFVAGLYIGDESGIERFIDSSAPPPGLPSLLTNFADPHFDDGNAAFIGYGADASGGVYFATPSQTFEIAKQDDFAPGASWRFLQFDDLSIDGSDMAFRGSDGSDQLNSGIYLWSGGTLTTVADYNTPIPGAPERFNYFFTTSVSEGNVAFWAKFRDVRGIYVRYQGELIKVIRQYDILDGQVVGSVSISPQSLSGSKIVFVAGSGGNTVGVYVADLAPIGTVEVPTLGPAMLAVLVLGLAAAALLHLRRRRSVSRPG